MSLPARTLTANQQDRRHRILSAARVLVARNGYDGMIMRDIASLAQVSPTTLYNLYHTKDELVLAALRERVAEGWSQASQEAKEPGFNRIMAQIHHSVKQTKEEPAYAQAITQALFRASRGDQIIQVLVHSTTRVILISLTAMQDAKELSEDIDRKSIAQALIGVLWMNYFMWSLGETKFDRLERNLYRDFLSLLLPNAKGKRKADIVRRLKLNI